MSTLALPYVFEDTTGNACGPAEFLDIYDRPPFLRVESVIVQTPQQTGPSGMVITIFELGAHASQSFKSGRQSETPPSAVISFHGVGVRGSIRFRAGVTTQLERWLKKSTTFGGTLTRQFKACDGKSYQWSYRKAREHEWVCLQLGTDRLVAHYDLKPAGGPRRTSGNVLAIYPKWIHLAVELLASLVIMRRIHADLSEERPTSL